MLVDPDCGPTHLAVRDPSRSDLDHHERVDDDFEDMP
jgi:hypothetical protein